MKKYIAICPHCGHINRDLYLDETEGMMECEKCRRLARIMKPVRNYAERRNYYPGPVVRKSAEDKPLPPFEAWRGPLAKYVLHDWQNGGS